MDAFRSVNRDGFSAAGAGPTVFFLRYELSDAEIPNIIKIFQHAHAVVFPVALVQIPQPAAGVLGASKAEMVGMAPFFTEFDATFPAGARLGDFLAVVAARAAVFFPQMPDAQRTVHSAGRNHSGLNRLAGPARFQTHPAFFLAFFFFGAGKGRAAAVALMRSRIHSRSSKASSIRK